MISVFAMTAPAGLSAYSLLPPSFPHPLPPGSDRGHGRTPPRHGYSVTPVDVYSSFIIKPWRALAVSCF